MLRKTVSNTPTLKKRKYDRSFGDSKKEKGKPKENKVKSVSKKQLIKDLEFLLNAYPGSPKFIGNIPTYKKGMMDRLFNTGEYSRLKSLKARISRHAKKEVDLYNKKDALELRKKWIEIDSTLNKVVHRYNHISDLHALSALHVYSDSKFIHNVNKRFPVLKKALIQMSGALHNQSISIFNVLWFVEIYLDYLKVYKKLLGDQLASTMDQKDKQVQLLLIQLKQKNIQLEILSAIEEKQDGVMMLNRKLRNSAYVTDGLNMMEIRRASNAIKKGDPKMTVSEGKVADFTVAVVVITTLLLARIPIFKNLVHEVLAGLSDGSRELRLQKRMIITTDIIHDFELAVAEGNRKSQTSLADAVYHYCQKTIKLYWQNASLVKPYEIDPFMKLAWITIESKGLYDTSTYRKKLEHCRQFLEILLSQPQQKNDTIQYSKLLLFTISTLQGEFS